jgi:hypothetical protein
LECLGKHTATTKIQINLYTQEKMRTTTLHKQKPLFRFKDTHLSRESVKREMMEALEAVLDAYEGSDSLIMMQCRSALDRARRNR